MAIFGQFDKILHGPSGDHYSSTEHKKSWVWCLLFDFDLWAGLDATHAPKGLGPLVPDRKVGPPGGKFFGNLLSYYCVWKIFRPWIPIGYIILALVIPSHSFLVPKSSFLRLNLIYVPATWVTDCFPFIQDSKKKKKKGPSNVSLTAETVGPGLHRRITEDLQYERILPKLDPTVRKRAINGIKPQSS